MSGERIGRALQAAGAWLGVRAVLWLGVALLAVLLVADVRSVIVPRPAARPAAGAPGPATPPDAGWPHRRGPHFDGTSDETGLADSWPEAGPPVLWTLELGQGYSGFTAVGDRVFTQTQTLYRQVVVCLDADTGQTLWEHGYAWPYQAVGMYPGPRATPTWHGGRIYFAGARGLVGCLDAAAGRPLWSLNVKEKFAGRGFDFGYACSPLVEQDKVILPAGGRGASVVALNPEDGSTVWASGNQPASYCSALPITLEGRRLVVAFLQNALALFDLETGRLLWQEVYSQGYDEHAADPIYREPYLMIASPFKSGAQAYRLRIEQGDGTAEAAYRLRAETAWFSRKMSNDVASCVVVDGHVYGFDLRDVQAKRHRPSRGKFKCLKLDTGQVLWETDHTGHASVIAADGKLVLLSDRGEILLVRATPERYEELARAEVFRGEICWTAPALYRGRLYLRSPTKAACVYLGKPELLQRERLDRARPTSEIPKSERLDLAWLVGGEREYVVDAPTARELWRWYVFSLLGVIAAAAALGAAVDLPLRRKWPGGARRAGRVVFWAAAFVLGVAGTPIFNRLWPQFVFTWPVSLLVAQQAALAAILSGSRRAQRRTSPWLSATAVFLFLGACLGYFHLCRQLGLAMQWIFLIGFLPSWPLAVPAARRMLRPGSFLHDLPWALLAFSTYYWACAAFVWWKMSGA